MTLAVLYHYGDRLRCGSDMMGITDFITFLHNSEPFRQPYARHEFGDERYPDMNKFLQSISPLNHVSEIQDPVMITAGKDDARVPVSESDQMVKALQAQKEIVWYILGENEGHNFLRASDSRFQFAAEAYFFQTYLLPKKRLTPFVSKPSSALPVSTLPNSD
jgi:dipeptidyl aminopeptidase/acylaminoacyl peptidase